VSANETPVLSPPAQWSEAERRRLLVEWNDTRVEYPSGVLLHQLVEAQAERTPESTAVVYEQKSLNYRELNARANQLAHRLQALGVGAGTLVGICIERSIEMVVGLLGILKAGGAYVPLDPEYPVDRLHYTLETSNVSVLLTAERFRQKFPGFKGTAISLDGSLDKESHAIAGESERNPHCPASENDPAYVLFTSGSTGRPKGVVIPHRAICNHMFWICAEFGFDKKDRLLQKTPFGFDASVWEFFAPLMCGGQLVMARPGGHADGAYMAKTIAENEITLLQLVPTQLQLLLAQKEFAECRTLRHVFCGGEALTVELQQDFFRAFDCGLCNLYGPTECTIDATFWRCKPRWSGRIVPIGRPVSNTQTYILDSDERPVPVGELGELYIGGAGLALGYLNRPELTAEKFVPNPFSNEGGARLYRTGDLARYLPTGDIEYLGRIDHQVKIRGLRIELGEIEAVLREVPGVNRALVIAREDVPGDKRLVAYVVAQQEFKSREIRAFLKKKLPDYMVPSAFVALEALPLSPNGKINRLALPAPTYDGAEREEDYVAPRSSVERKLAEIWSELLSIERVGVRDNFFDLGGHSLLAVRLFERVSRDFGQKLSLNVLFESPTVEQLAALLEAPTHHQRTHYLVPIRPHGSRPPFYWIPGGRALSVLAFREISLLLGEDQPVYGLESTLPEPGERIESVPQRAFHYLQQIRTLQREGPYYLGGFCLGGLVAFEMARQLYEAGDAVAFLALINCEVPGLPNSLAARAKTKFQRAKYRLSQNPGFRPEKIARHLRTQMSLWLNAGWKSTAQAARAADRDLETQLANLGVMNQYAPTAYPGAVEIFISRERDYLGVSPALDPRRAWRRFAREANEAEVLPGDHISMLQQPHVAVFADELRNRLQRAQAANAEKAGMHQFCSPAIAGESARYGR
jgi:amino acid adenylation domain-containing protein